MNTFQDIDLLLETKMKTDKAIAEYADTLRIQLSRLDSAGRPQQKSKVAGATRFSAVVRRLRTAVSVLPSNSYLLTPLFCILIGIAVGYCVHYLPSITQDKPPAVIPATETLEEFVAREASRLLTTDERGKLIAVAERILQQDFSRPSAIVEEFTFQRRLAGIDSPAFNAFSDKWAAKVETMPTESVEAMREIYRSLLRGLQVVKATVDFSDEPVEVFSLQSFPSNVTSETATEDVPDSSDILSPQPLKEVEAKPPLVPTVQRQRLFR